MRLPIHCIFMYTAVVDIRSVDTADDALRVLPTHLEVPEVQQQGPCTSCVGLLERHLLYPAYVTLGIMTVLFGSRWFFAKGQLEDGCTFSDCDSWEEFVVYLVFRLRGGVQIFVEVM
jgi:hypothetical protein